MPTHKSMCSQKSTWDLRSYEWHRTHAVRLCRVIGSRQVITGAEGSRTSSNCSFRNAYGLSIIKDERYRITKSELAVTPELECFDGRNGKRKQKEERPYSRPNQQQVRAKEETGAVMQTSLLLVTLSTLVVAWLVVRWQQRQRPLPAGIAHVMFEDGDDSYQRYFDNTRAVATEGYVKVCCSPPRAVDCSGMLTALSLRSISKRAYLSPCTMRQTRIFHCSCFPCSIWARSSMPTKAN